MKVSSIGYNQLLVNSFGNKTKKNHEERNQKSNIQPNLNNKADKALKTLLISAMIASPSVINTSCDKWVETDYDHWENENPMHFKDYLYVVPSRKLDNIMLPVDSISVKHNFIQDENLNKNLNNMLNALNIPRMTEGNLPVNMSYLTDGKAKKVINMSLNDTASEDGKYVYEVTKYEQDGSENSCSYTFSASGNDIKLSIDSNGQNSEYLLKLRGNEVDCYKNSNGEEKRCAIFCESKLPNQTGKKAHCIVKESFDDQGITSDLAVMSNFNLWSYSPDIP